jgi:nucleotide-binding universal stress UspA family protein
VPAAVPALAGFDTSGYRRALEEDARGRLRTLRPASNGHRVVEEVRVGKAHDEILSAADQYGADLIAMGVHGHGALERTLFGSTAYNVVRRATCPVLTARSA